MNDNDTRLEYLSELDRLWEVLNKSFLARASGRNRSVLANWRRNKVDMKATITRRNSRKKILEVLEEIHAETERILKGESKEDCDYPFKNLGKKLVKSENENQR